MFRKALIANRGEIACRIARTARLMGISSVAVFSDADRDARHVGLADEAWRLGPAPARESYLCIEKIIDIAIRSGAEAVHPGYGFLAESAAFAEACAQAGLVFIGPAAHTMRKVGDKAGAKRLMAELGVPTLPGFHGEAQDLPSFARAAGKAGYPVVVKASAGGGGRGLRVVRLESELPGAMDSASREAQAAFGDSRLLLEKYIEKPRHVEVQFVADRFGNVATFYERDCSLQRRHQKVIEESPAPCFPPEMRAVLWDATRRIARASDYLGAGTAEFLVDGDSFYFLEVNARLQVEHPVTEMIAGVDLVAWQFRVASGEPLPRRQAELSTNGCAIEARLCAEEPAHGFRPSTGVITHFKPPAESAAVRIETGVRAGDAITSDYDSLLAKIIVWDEERDGAIRLLESALASFELVGIGSNLDFLRALLRNEDFISGRPDTSVAQRVVAAPAPSSDAGLILAAAVACWRESALASLAAADPLSPWATGDSWRLYGTAFQKLAFRFEDLPLECAFEPTGPDQFRITTSEGAFSITARREGERLTLIVDGRRRDVAAVSSGSGWVVIVNGRNHSIERVEAFAPPSDAISAEGPLTAPLPARVAKILVKRGDHIEKGASLLLLEAMKMEIPLHAPREGIVKEIYCDEGQSVREGEELLAWRAIHDAA